MNLHRRDFLLAAGLAGSGAFFMFTGCAPDAPAAKPKPAAAPPDTPAAAPPPPPSEFRGVWVASVANIDWPSRKGLPADALRAEMIAILDRCAALKLNAVLLQVRPSCDTIYPSRLEPWSEFLTGRSGKPPEPEFDPLAEWIEQAHARGIELHAWFNPFRARHHKAEFPDAPSHITNARPELVHTWGDLKWLDPSEPDAREHSLRVILDVASRYNIDGIHLDDYFYPYPRDAKPAPGSSAPARREEFPDDHQWSLYQSGGGTLSRSDWRRSHIDGFVRDLYAKCKALKPGLTFGISPFGIWRPGCPTGIEGFDAYEGLFADARKWLREGWIDYMAPQLYWAVNAPKQPFGPLLDWWRNENLQNRHIWPGLYTSRIEGEGKWTPDEIVRQITESRTRPTSGHIHFSMATFTANRGDVVPTLSSQVYLDDAIIPVLSPTSETSAPSAFTSASEEPGKLRLWWSSPPDPASPATRRWIVQANYGTTWTTSAYAPGRAGADVALETQAGKLNAIAIRRVDTLRQVSKPAMLTDFASIAAKPQAS